jgi:hypothetical protein
LGAGLCFFLVLALALGLHFKYAEAGLATLVGQGLLVHPVKVFIAHFVLTLLLPFYRVPPVGVRNFGQQVCIRSLKLQRAPKPTAILLTDLARRVVTAVETFVRRSDMLLPRGVPLMRPDGKDSVARARAGAHSPAEPPSPLANQVSAPRWNSIYPGKPFSVSW